jgi:hypothetical protein
LNPIERSDAIELLAAALGEERAETVANHFEKRGLAGLWSNPQTLALVQDVALKDQLPSSKGELFRAALELLAYEHREERADTSNCLSVPR